jgi:hypothetical protein
MPTMLAAFFDRYQRAFERRQVDKLLDIIAVPCLVATGHHPSAVTDTDTLRTRLEAQVERHAEAGVADATFEITAHRRLAPGLLQAEVRWTFADANARPLTTFDLMYLITVADDGWRIIVVAPVESIGGAAVTPTR